MTESDTLTLPAPAKLNLFLHITGQKDNGYHQLQTIFQLLDFGDELTLRKLPASASSIAPLELESKLKGVADADNIVIQAAERLRRYSGCQYGAQIKLLKRTPMGGGMGGGSSDAASTLLGLNQLWSLGLSLDDLASIGVELGADVPIFIYGENSFAEGIGEQLKPINLPDQWFVVVKPPIEVTTATIFAHSQLTRDSQAIRIPAFFDPSTNAKDNAVQQQRDFLAQHSLKNDCEAVVRAEYPQIDRALEQLARFGNARLTGTGSCIFAGFSGKEQAEATLQAVSADTDNLCWIAKSSTRSTAHSALAQFQRGS